MATNTLKTRIQHKNGSASDWSQATTFVPLKGELIIYNDATTPKIKVGDGATLVENLPFVGASITMNGAIASSPSFYAPTTAGTAGQVLKSNGSGAPTWAAEYSYTLPTATSSVLGGVKVGSNITVSSGTISLTKANVTAALGYTPPTSDTNTTYSAGTGISLSGTTFSNSGVRSISTGSSNGTISVNTNGTSANVAVKGLGSAAYLASTDLIHSVSLATDGTLRVNNGSGTSILSLGNYYLKLSGGTVTGNINIQGTSYPSFCLQPTTANSAGTYTGGFFEGSYVDNVSMWVWTDRNNSAKSRRGLVLYGYAQQTNDNYALALRRCDTSGNWQSDLNILHSGNFSSYALSLSGGTISGNLTVTGTITGTKVYGAVWNDYAEYRSQNETIEPGYITYCDDDGKLKKTAKRLQKYEGVVSDTFGFAIGETDDCKTPLAVSGRALVYCDPEEHFHSGDCVCAGPNGLAYRMMREEIIEFPDRIVGVVSEIPTYETWGTGNVKVDGRIWIKIK